MEKKAAAEKPFNRQMKLWDEVKRMKEKLNVK
jgi:hypothetical protein